VIPFLKQITNAIQRETSLKRWKRTWKIALIEKVNPNWDVEWVFLEPDKACHAVLLHKRRTSPLTMSSDPLEQVGGHSKIESSVSLAREQIDKAPGHELFFDCWVAGSSPAMVIYVESAW
jgi:hypothetical protein